MPASFVLPILDHKGNIKLQDTRVFHLDRWKSVHCLRKPRRAFALELDAPCLAAPSRGDWYELLRGRTLAFVGDSVLRDFYFLLVATLLMEASARNLTTSGTFGIHGFGALHPGTKPHHSWAAHYNATSILHVTVAPADGREPPTCLLWCWYTDTAASLRDARFASDAELYVLHHGSHEPPGSFADPLRPPTVLAGYTRMLRARGTPVIWVEYAAAHFPWGAGEFEDDRGPGLERLAARPCCDSIVSGTTAVNGTSAAAALSAGGCVAAAAAPARSCDPRPCRSIGSPANGSTATALSAGGCITASTTACGLRACRPIGTCASPVAIARLTSLRDAYERAGALVLPMWDMSAAGGHAEHNQVVAGSFTPGQRKNLAASHLLDCRHYCNPGSMTVGWSRRLFAMLSSPADGRVLEGVPRC